MLIQSQNLIRVFLFSFIILIQGCAFQQVTRSKNLTYLKADSKKSLPEKQLNVFAPKGAKDLPVLIFIHGGSWKSGNKEIYDFLGSRMARKEIVTVIIDYPLAPANQIQSMELAAVQSVIWTRKNIEKFGGNPDQIFISGHSAGGHLAALVGIKESNFLNPEIQNSLKGAILIDPAGLDMYWYLQETAGTEDGTKYLGAFTEDPEVWKAASPIYFLDGETLPILIMEGEKTYPGIRLTVDRFRKEAEVKEVPLDYEFYKNKKHIPMITQFFWTGNRGYKEVLGFIEENK
ncbi:MAG: alpha/beta hydrolase [Algoriphagus sp.]|nr:alpha/beta hydrolase [Algoriphagus sp.]